MVADRRPPFDVFLLNPHLQELIKKMLAEEESEREVKKKKKHLLERERYLNRLIKSTRPLSSVPGVLPLVSVL